MQITLFPDSNWCGVFSYDGKEYPIYHFDFYSPMCEIGEARFAAEIPDIAGYIAYSHSKHQVFLYVAYTRDTDGVIVRYTVERALIRGDRLLVTCSYDPSDVRSIPYGQSTSITLEME